MGKPNSKTGRKKDLPRKTNLKKNLSTDVLGKSHSKTGKEKNAPKQTGGKRGVPKNTESKISGKKDTPKKTYPMTDGKKEALKKTHPKINVNKDASKKTYSKTGEKNDAPKISSKTGMKNKKIDPKKSGKRDNLKISRSKKGVKKNASKKSDRARQNPRYGTAEVGFNDQDMQTELQYMDRQSHPFLIVPNMWEHTVDQVKRNLLAQRILNYITERPDQLNLCMVLPPDKLGIIENLQVLPDGDKFGTYWQDFSRCIKFRLIPK